MVTLLDQIRNIVRQMAMIIANIPGHKVVMVGGSVRDWAVPRLFDQYAISARHWFIVAFDNIERGGG
eukprot:3159932-Prorocentrum_lima.AAC.1